jgi:hypothetical protein
LKLNARSLVMAGRDSPRPQQQPSAAEAPQASSLRGVPERVDKRPLKELEVQVLRKVFAEGLSYGPVRLVRMSNFIAQLNGARAFVLGNALNLPGRDFDAISQGANMSLLVHEAVHIWQYQHRGWGYVAEALWAQGFGEGYDYVKALRAGRAWRKMNPEQQAQLIQDAYRSSYFDAPGARFGVQGDAKAGSVIPPGKEPPAGFTDYTAVLVAALELLQKPA